MNSTGSGNEREAELRADISAAISELGVALSYYDRALFHFEHRPKSKHKVDTSLSLINFLSAIDQLRSPDSSIADLHIARHRISANTLWVYSEVFRALACRHHDIFESYADQLVDTINKKISIIDRNPDYAYASAHSLYTDCRKLRKYIRDSLREEKRRGSWSSHKDEFALLGEDCKLLTDEIVFLFGRVEALGHLNYEYDQENQTRFSIYLAFGGIVVNAMLVSITILVTVFPQLRLYLGQGDGVKGNDTSNSTLAIEVGKISERTESLQRSLDESLEILRAFQTQFKDRTNAEDKSFQEIERRITALKTLLEQRKDGVSPAELQKALDGVKNKLKKFLNTEVVPLLQDDATNSEPVAVLDDEQYRALEGMFNTLTNEIDKMQADIDRLNTQSTDNSKRAIIKLF